MRQTGAETIRILVNISSTGIWKPYFVGGTANGPRAIRIVYRSPEVPTDLDQGTGRTRKGPVQ